MPAVQCGLRQTCFIAATTAADWRSCETSPMRALVPLIAVNDVLYHAPERRALQDIVTCIREHRTLEEAGRLLEANAERHLKSAEEMARLFGATSKAIGQTTRFLKRCRFSLDELKPHYPERIPPRLCDSARGARRADRSGGSTAIPERRAAKMSEKTLEQRIGGNQRARLRCLFSDCPRHRPICRVARDPLSGPWFCRQLTRLLLSYISPLSVPSGQDFCSSDSCPRSAASRRTSTSISSMSAAKRSFSISTSITRRRHAALTATVIPIGVAAPSAMSARYSAFPRTSSMRSTRSIWGWSMEGVTREQALRAGLDASDPRLNQTLCWPTVVGISATSVPARRRLCHFGSTSR